MARPQHADVLTQQIREAFLTKLADEPLAFSRRLTLSWSNWGFGVEGLEAAAARLVDAGLTHIELHGNLYGEDLGYQASEVNKLLADHALSVSGVCGMFGVDNDLSSNVPSQRQRAVDYIRRQVEFTKAVGGSYLLVVPGAVGRPVPYDDAEWHRSVETLRRAADVFEASGVRAAIEPIRGDEVSLVHTVDDAVRYIEAVDHPGVQHINGDVFHMQSSEQHIGQALLAAGDRLVNLHMADSNRRALGSGSMDLDTIIRALYLIGYNTSGRYVTPEPLGPGSDPYRAMWAAADDAALRALVTDSVTYFREREEAVLAGI